jgi:phosphoribosylamine--glycine ligase
MKILVVGGGGREHALCWKLTQSTKIEKIFCAPGNPGISTVAECVNIKDNDLDALIDFAVENKVDLVVPGPELPLVMGIADMCREHGIPVFGPRKYAAQLEGSKVFAREFMARHGIPSADFASFTDMDEALKYLETVPLPTVVKADGLAAGKGVAVCESREDAAAFVRELMQDKKFGASGSNVLIEECLGGEETSILAIADGKTFTLLTPAQDHKRAYDEDKGPNTGGMGAYSPVSLVDEEMLQEVSEHIIQPVLDGMAEEGCPFTGVIYAGLMITYKGPHVLEFNVRFGDPEAQAVLPLINGDLAEMLLAAARGELATVDVPPADKAAMCIVMAAGGYPGDYEKGQIIYGLKKASEVESVVVFHAGTAFNANKEIVTNGGRVLGVTAIGDNLPAAHHRAYEAVSRIQWEGVQHRKDIGKRELDRIVK